MLNFCSHFSIWTLKKEHIKEIICRAKRGKKIMEKLNRAQKCSILGPQNLGSRGARAPGAPPPDPHLYSFKNPTKYVYANMQPVYRKTAIAKMINKHECYMDETVVNVCVSFAY